MHVSFRITVLASVVGACMTPYTSAERKPPTHSPTRMRTEPDWSTTDYAQYPPFIEYRTSAATWSTSGGFGLRWGMGPADVRDQFRDLTYVSAESLAYDPSQYEF